MRRKIASVAITEMNRRADMRSPAFRDGWNDCQEQLDEYGEVTCSPGVYDSNAMHLQREYVRGWNAAL